MTGADLQQRIEQKTSRLDIAYEITALYGCFVVTPLVLTSEAMITGRPPIFTAIGMGLPTLMAVVDAINSKTVKERRESKRGAMYCVSGTIIGLLPQTQSLIEHLITYAMDKFS